MREGFGLLQTNFLAGLVVADLLHIVGDFDGQQVATLGTLTAGDGSGEADWYWDADMTTEPADEVTYQPAGVTTGRWVMKSKIVIATCRLTDVSTAGSAYAVAPVNGKIIKIRSVLEAAVTVADSLLTTAIKSGGGAFTAITAGGWTVPFTGSAIGDTFAATPSAANTVSVGDALRVTSDGGSTTTAGLLVEFVIKGVV